MEVSDSAAGKVGRALSFSAIDVGTFTCFFNQVGNGYSIKEPGVLSFVIQTQILVYFSSNGSKYYTAISS